MLGLVLTISMIASSCIPNLPDILRMKGRVYNSAPDKGCAQ